MVLRTARVALVVVGALALGGCPLGPTEVEAAGGKATYFGYRAATCASAATPLPGYRNCTISVAVRITKALTSGTVAVLFSYPGGGSFYRGQLSGLAGFVGTKELTLSNNYVSSCPSIQTTVDVYDGPLSEPNAPLLHSVTAKIGPLC